MDGINLKAHSYMTTVSCHQKEHYLAAGQKIGRVPFVEPMPFTFALWARLAEIGIRVTFVALTSIAVLIFEEIEEEIENLAEMSNDPEQHDSLAINLDQLIVHNDLACRLIQQINRCFGFVLLIITAMDFISTIYEFYLIKTELSVDKWTNNLLFYKTWEDVSPALPKKNKYIYKGILHCAKFCHDIVYYTVLLIASHRINSKVQNHSFLCLYFEIEE